MVHAVDIQTQVSEWPPDANDQGFRFRYRWRCSCGDRGCWNERPNPAIAARRARNGGGRHVASMERSKP